MSEMSLWLTMNDAIRLDATVCTPEGPAPDTGWPLQVLVHGHGEDGSKASTLDRGRRVATQGYVALCYSVRGQGGSEGLSSHLGPREIFDLQDVVAFARDQLPVDPDRVAVCGSSQGGWHAWMAAIHVPGLATAVPENIFVDYGDFAVPQGALSTWFFNRTMRRRVMSGGLQDLARQWAIEGHWDRLRTLLSPMSPRWFADRIRCPVMVVHGWHDVGMPANDLLEMFDALAVDKLLLLGGGGHDGQDATSAAQARVDRVDQWLAAHLLGGSREGLDARVIYARRPGWTEVAAVGLTPRTHQTWYLRHGGTLSEVPPTTPTPNSNVNHVPRDPSYTLATALHRDLVGSEAAWPREAVAFDSPPLASDLDVVGIPRFEIHTLPQGPCLQIHAELFDVDPEGNATLVTRAHQGLRDAAPGMHRVLQISARAIAYRIAAGHRIRIVVADQNPTFVVPAYRPWRARLFHEVGRCSQLILPVG